MNVEVNVTCPSPGIPPPSLSSRSILGSDDTANTQLNAWWDLRKTLTVCIYIIIVRYLVHAALNSIFASLIFFF